MIWQPEFTDKTLSRKPGAVQGLLIYPHVDTAVKHRYKINGFDIGLCTVNLGQEWPCIHQELLAIFDEYLK
ncbi:hypothetical protein B6V68_24605 [Escherichia coli]|nr:hypothetical protein [Escherichia coli]